MFLIATIKPKINALFYDNDLGFLTDMGEIKKGKTPIPKQVNIDLLRKVCTILNESETDYFLTCGTLLGYIREGDFIDWDSDIDLGVFEIKEFKRIIPDLEAKKLVVKRHSPAHGIRMSLSYQIKDAKPGPGLHSHVDIFEFEKTSRGILFRMVNTRGFVDRMRRSLLALHPRFFSKEEPAAQDSLEGLIQASRLPSRLAEPIIRIKKWTSRNLFLRQYQHIFDPFTPMEVSWFDMQVKIPSNPEDHLRLLFGDNWRIPNPEYSRSLERQKNIRRVRL